MAVDYEQIRPSLRTGDIVLFSGRRLISRLIQIGTLSRWSHVGVVIRLPDNYNTVLLMESTTISRVRDYFTRRVIRGVSMVLLSDRVRTYKGRVAVRRLVNVDRDDEFEAAFARLRRQLHGRRYETSLMELLRSAVDLPFWRNRRDLSSVFCSELVAEGYIRAGLLSGKMPPNEYTPDDFAHIRLKKGDLTGIEEIK